MGEKPNNLMVGDRVKVIRCDAGLHVGEFGKVHAHRWSPPGVPDPREYEYGVKFDDGGPICGFNRGELEFIQTSPGTIVSELVMKNGPGRKLSEQADMVHHPEHYGGGDNPYEVVKVLFAWGLWTNAYLWNTVKYIARHRRKGKPLEDLKKARWYLDEEIKRMEASEAQTSSAD